MLAAHSLRLRARSTAEPVDKLAITPDGKLIYGDVCPVITRKYFLHDVSYVWTLSIAGYRFGTYFDSEGVYIEGRNGDFFTDGASFDDFSKPAITGSLNSIALPDGATLTVPSRVWRNGAYVFELTTLTVQHPPVGSRLWLPFSRSYAAWECDGAHPEAGGVDIFTRDPLSFIFPENQIEIRRVLRYGIVYHAQAASGRALPFVLANGGELYNPLYGSSYLVGEVTMTFHYNTAYDSFLKGYVYLCTEATSSISGSIFSEAGFVPFPADRVFYIPISRLMPT